MKIVRVGTAVVARFLISLIFLSGAIHKILNWHDTEKSLMNTLAEWQSNLIFSDQLQDFFAIIIPMAPAILILATLLELLGGLLLLLGVKEKLGATLLILFLIPTTVIIHQFWFVEGSVREIQMVHFFKNLAILGGLLMVLLKQNDESQDSYDSY